MTLLAQSFEGLSTIKRLYPASLQCLVSGVQHFACLSEFKEIPGHRVFNEVVRSAACSRREIVNPRFGFGTKSHFHRFRIERSVVESK